MKASKVTGGSSAKWNLGLNNARGSNLQVECNGITLNSVTLDQPIVSVEFEQGGYLQTMNSRLKKFNFKKRKIFIRPPKY